MSTNPCSLPIFQVDAFASEAFRGNPAAVVLLDSGLPDRVMQAIAAENNLSETAFPLKLEEGRFSLRWFTPTLEVDLCGHATLATAFVLFEKGLVSGNKVVFETRSGLLDVEKVESGLRMNFPARPPSRCPVPELLVRALGVEPVECWDSRDLMAVLETEEAVASLRPDFDRIARLDSFALIVTAPGREVDFVSRFFAPKAGVPEDPVTGSAHSTLTPYWAQRLGKQRLRARQVSARGGEILCEMSGDRVLLTGQAVEYLRGEIFVP